MATSGSTSAKKLPSEAPLRLIRSSVKSINASPPSPNTFIVESEWSRRLEYEWWRGGAVSLDVGGEGGVVDGPEDAEVVVPGVPVLVAVGHDFGEDEALLVLFLALAEFAALVVVEV